MPWPQLTSARGGGDISAFLSHPYLGPQRALEGNLALLLQPTCPHQSILCYPPSLPAGCCHPPVSQRLTLSPLLTYAGWPHPTLSPKDLGRGLGLGGAIPVVATCPPEELIILTCHRPVHPSPASALCLFLPIPGKENSGEENGSHRPQYLFL